VSPKHTYCPQNEAAKLPENNFQKGDNTGMMKPWNDPTKRPASVATLNMTADWDEFTDLMKRIVVPKKKEPIAPASPAPAES
jgi:hypothetical protein